MLRPLSPIFPAIPAPQATVPYNTLRQPQTALQTAPKFGNAKAPTSANPFVWVLNGIKSVFEWFSKTKVGQWVNRFFSKINQFLKAKPKEAPKPASSAPSPKPSPTPAPAPTTMQPTASSAPTPPEASPAAPPGDASGVAPVSPEPAGGIQPLPQPIVPTATPCSELSLQTLQEEWQRYGKQQESLSTKHAELERKLRHLQRLHNKQSRKLEKAQQESAKATEKALVPDMAAAIELLNREIETLRTKAEGLQASLNKVSERIPQIKYWLQLRQNLQAAK